MNAVRVGWVETALGDWLNIDLIVRLRLVTEETAAKFAADLDAPGLYAQTIVGDWNLLKETRVDRVTRMRATR